MSTNTAVRRTWAIDPAHSEAQFTVRHMMFAKVRGHFAKVSGTIELDQADLTRSSVDVTIDAASIDTREAQRDAHLRSADFLDADRFPTIVFRSRRIEGAKLAEGESFRVIGDLTIHGVTREVALDAAYEGRGRDPWGGERVSFSATTKIDRREFGLTWNAALEAGGVLVSNDIRIQLEVQAVRA